MLHCLEMFQNENKDTNHNILDPTTSKKTYLQFVQFDLNFDDLFVFFLF